MFVFFAYVFFDMNKTNKIEKKFLLDLNLQMTGVVKEVDKATGFRGRGVIDIKILNSNVDEYDPRNFSPIYYCIIKNGIAEVYDSNALYCDVGDTVLIDTKKKFFSYKNVLKLKQKYDMDIDGYGISVETNDDFYKYAKAHHQKF